MRQSVRDAFVAFSTKFEGAVPFLYLDILGLVTTGIGNLVDPVDMALALPFQKPSGEDATPAEIRAEWNAVKGRQDLAPHGGMIFERITTLRLTDDGIQQLVAGKLDQMAAYLLKRFPFFEEWPAPAQLGLLSMAWAAGPGFMAPKFQRACNMLDFATAAAECHLADEHNPGLKPRNEANYALFEAAAIAQASGSDYDLLPC